MLKLTLLFFVPVLFSFVFYRILSKKQAFMPEKEKSSYGGVYAFGIVCAAFLLRIVIAGVNPGHQTDMSCFLGWADLVYRDGFANFYPSEVFTDYPPGYIYVLYLIGGLRKFFGLVAFEPLSLLLVKIPAILCDLIAGVLIYRRAQKSFSTGGALFAMGIYLFHPALILNSCVWGQVDSVYTLCLILMFLFMEKGSMKPAYFAFAVGIFIKPQMLFFGPVILLAFIDFILLKDFSWKRFFVEVGTILLAIASVLLLALPFGIPAVLAQYFETISSYPYASINAYNFWTMVHKNWTPETEKFLFLPVKTWGMAALVLLCVFFFVVYYKWKKKQMNVNYYLAGALINGMIFTFSTHMHERYLYPSMVLLLLAWVVSGRKEIPGFYLTFSLVHYWNTGHALYNYDPMNFSRTAMFPIIIGSMTVMLTVVFMRYCKNFSGNVQEEEQGNEKKTVGDKEKIFHFFLPKKQTAIAKKEWIAVLVLTVIYAGIAFYNLGSHEAPEKFYQSDERDELVLVADSFEPISSIGWYLGNYEKRKFTVEGSMDGISYHTLTDFTMDSVFCWDRVELPGGYPFIRLIPHQHTYVIGELVLYDASGNVLTPKAGETQEALFDENSLIPESFTYREGTYFDEIYHARTAYEYLNELYSYENTHPPLGKILIACGIRLFGMNPFGWRFTGTLFGVLMIPVFYLLVRSVLKRYPLFSYLATVLFTFDFMHFSQTRIATIDVYVTFFILVAYYFMWKYVTQDIYRTSWKKSLLPLGFCGVFMGISIACKWTGVYSALGLAVIFFFVMGIRIREYLYAVKNPEGITDGVSHEAVIKQFKQYLIGTILFCIGFFVIIPFVIYLLSYIPFSDGTGNGLWERMIKNQKTMFSYHSNLTPSHPYASRWYSWPMVVRPIFYYSGQLGEGMAEGISAMGNPLVWWLGIPAFIYLCYRLLKNRDKTAGFLIIGYLAQYLPWSLISRDMFIYHYFPSVGFVVVMIGYSISVINLEKKKKTIGFVCYTVLAIGLFAMFYPVLSGAPVSKSYVEDWLRWFDSWVLLI